MSRGLLSVVRFTKGNKKVGDGENEEERRIIGIVCHHQKWRRVKGRQINDGVAP